MKNKKLNYKQQKFCDYYIVSGNSKIAAQKAGYQSSYGAKLLLKKEIKQAINKKDALAIARKEEVLAFLTDLLRGDLRKKNKKNIKIKKTLEKNVEKTKEPSVRERLKAAELLGRHYGLYTGDSILENQEVEIKIEIVD